MAFSLTRSASIWQCVGLCPWLFAAATACASGPTFESFESLLRAREVQSVEDALPLLPADLLENYTLVFASRSLQGASQQAPRAILFGTTARFVVSFNGDEKQRGYDALETMQFDEKTNSFHFREMRFGAEAGLTVSEDNPARCTACHGIPARPIWDTPPTWPGVYGERYRAGLSKDEIKGIGSFLAQQERSPRYRHLVNAGRFANRATYVVDAHVLYGGGSFEPPNARLSSLLASLNARALVTALSAPPAAGPHRYALLGAATGSCGGVEAFFPPAVTAQLRVALESFARQGVARNESSEDAKRLRRHGASGGYQGGVRVADPVELRFVAEQIVGVPAQRWSLALEGDTYDLTAPDGALTLEQLLYERVATEDPELHVLHAFRSYTPDDIYCTELRRRSVRELSGYYSGASAMLTGTLAGKASAAMQPRPQIVERCIQCHTGAIGPDLPFDDPATLGRRLVAPGYPRGRLLDEILYRLTPEAGGDRMPRGLSPTAGEQRELELYFLGLALQQGSAKDR